MIKKIAVFLLLTSFLLNAGCVPQAAPASKPPAAATAAEAASPAPQATEPPQEAPPAAPPEEISKPSPLTVLAAASLTEPFNEIAAQFEGENPGTKVELSFAGSQQLAQQLADGAPADVFASASKKYMDISFEKGRVNKQDAQTFAKNRLVVIYPTNNPFGLKELKDLEKPGLKLVLGAKEVPVGQYALDFLDKAAKDASYGQAYKDNTVKNVVSYEDNVKAVLTKIILGEGDAGIVYSSDISGEARDKVGKIDIPDELNVIATYPIAPINDSVNIDLAKAFVAKVLSKDGQDILAKYGFQSVQGKAESGAEGKGIVVTDALDRQVTFSAPPQRIAIVGKALFMLADAAYAFPEALNRVAFLGDTAQGTHNFIPLIDPAYNEKSTLGMDVGAEQVAAVNPDAVLMKSYLAETLGQPLEVLGIPVIYLNLEIIDQYPQDINTLGQLFQNEERAAKIIAFFQERVDRIQNTLNGLDEAKKPRVLLLYYSEKEGAVAFNVPPLTWMQTELVEKAGGIPVWKDANLGKGWTKINLEQIIAWDADQIYIISYFKDANEVLDGLKADPQWQAMRAVKEGNLYPFASDLYSWDQPDIRWVLGLTWLAGKLHPDLFPDLDITVETTAFYKEIYGMDEAAIEKDVLPKLSY